MPIDLRSKKILVTGGAGFVGSHVVDKLRERGVSEKNIFVPRFKDYDLRTQHDCEIVVKQIGKSGVIIHLAAIVGGIGYNIKHPAELFYDNLTMGVHLIEEARKWGIEKFVAIGTICSYPESPPIPFKEENLWDGYPEATNAPYGLAKKMMIVQGQAYRKQYGMNIINLLPVNMYGPRDRFDPSVSHVIPALIRKIAQAENEKYLDIWGTGKASREFLYVKDAAEGIVLATEKYDKPEPVNLGSGMEISIKELAELLCKLMNFKGELRWDASKPDGQPRRFLDVSKAEKEFGFKAKTDFEIGLKETINWYLANRFV